MLRNWWRTLAVSSFFIDDTLDYVDKMEQIFKEIKKDEDK